MNKYIPPEAFIDKWLEAVVLGKGQRWISKELGIGYSRVGQRACYLRRYGVELPHLLNGRNNRKYDIDRKGWNEKIKDFLDEQDLQDTAYVPPEGL